jgi:hypothetical protein
MKNTVAPTTKKLLGALAIIGLMSVVLAKFFSDLAFADGQSTTVHETSQIDVMPFKD